jgi:hypothetical protein
MLDKNFLKPRESGVFSRSGEKLFYGYSRIFLNREDVSGKQCYKVATWVKKSMQNTTDCSFNYNF